MNKILKFSYITLFLAAFTACTCNQKSLTVSVSNSLDIDRGGETVRVDLGALSSTSGQFIVVEKASGNEILAQLVDEDADSTYEAILFQVDLKASETKEFVIKEGATTIEPTEVKTFGRFVPERYDDFIWENDKVAFRMYGPTLKKLKEEGNPEGGISGGLDCWLKKVNYSVINKWIKGYESDHMFYHSDRGEGLDNYHVGPGLGAGGTGVMVNDSLVQSINFTNSHVLLNGPIKTKFVLDYDPYGAGDVKVQEQKTVSIDLGSNLTKFSISVEGTDVLTSGITLHENDGELTVDSTAVFVDYYAPYFGNELGNAIVVDPKYYAGYTCINSEEKDHSIILLHLNVIDGKVEYYAGFAWSESKQFSGKEEWESYLANFAKKIQNPLHVTVK